MRQPLLFVHLFGMVMWMGGGMAAMTIGLATRRLSRAELAAAVQLQGRIIRGLALPGSLLVVLTGLMLTLSLYGSATSVGGFPAGLMLMQGAGLVAAGVTLVVTAPTVARLIRLDPAGPHAALFDLLRRRAGISGMVSGVLGVAALLGGVLMR